ncbi:hypothetical protein SPV1_12215 [Mariprofundus ferrooxydans PV-1]|uniref:Uncharacterized protein n=1 Tax=Mariprofundus ferrooxydans PV-1 TaxID=314345 RepID=Q0EVW1_9PROT|nr:hypothetical protein SPV1_12215 [Mariprofundus ferrooxydans PV-1]
MHPIQIDESPWLRHIALWYIGKLADILPFFEQR